MSIQDEIPRSRINLRYRTNIKGEGELLELPFRLLILADLSMGSSTDRETDLDSRRLRSLDGKNLDAVMDDMRMSVQFNVKNFIDGGSEDNILVDIPIKNRRSFFPDHVANSVPKIRALLLLRRLLLETQSNIDNRKDLRRIINEIYSNPDLLNSLRDELSSLSGYKVPISKALAARAAEPSA